VEEGRLTEAVDALTKAQQAQPPAPWWTVAWFTGLVNAQNGHVDEAIADFERILDAHNQPRERKFDFRRDYVVINELGATLFKRSQQADSAAERDTYLRRAVQQFERTLKIDPEDLDAHYGLAQCFIRLGEGIQLEGSKPSGNPDETALMALAGTFVDGNVQHDKRVQAGADLCLAVAEFGRQSLTADQPKLPILLALIRQCQPIYESNADDQLSAAAAKVLGNLYRQTHAVFKPDDNAKDRAVRIYRENHRAAAEASQAVVIYPSSGPRTQEAK